MLLGSMAVKSSTTSLRWASVSPSMYRWWFRSTGGGGKDEEASCLLIEEYFACFPAIINCSSMFETKLTIVITGPQARR
jgi:hypothetical protein